MEFSYLLEFHRGPEVYNYNQCLFFQTEHLCHLDQYLCTDWNVKLGPERDSINCIPPFLGSCFKIITFLSDSSHLVLPNERIYLFL